MVYLILIGIIIFILGLIIGVVIGSNYVKRRVFGTIKWAWSEDGPYLFLDMDRRPEDMQGCQYVVFKTDLRAPPQE